MPYLDHTYSGIGYHATNPTGDPDIGPDDGYEVAYDQPEQIGGAFHVVERRPERALIPARALLDNGERSSPRRYWVVYDLDQLVPA